MAANITYVNTETLYIDNEHGCQQKILCGGGRVMALSPTSPYYSVIFPFPQ